MKSDESLISNPKSRKLQFELGRKPLVLLFILLLASAVSAQDVPIPESPTQWVTDTAGFVSPSDVERLNARLRSYQEQTQHQLIVWIGTTTGEVPIEDWANRAFEKWRVGRKGIDDGIALFIMAKDRRLRFEVGYGLESDVPDLRAKRIIDEIIVPRIRAGDNAGAIEAGLEAVAEAIGTPLPGGTVTRRDVRPPQDAQPMTLGRLIVFAIIGLIVLGIFASSPGFAMWLLISLLSGGNRRGGRRGGGWYGGGGWGGGGWRGGGGWSGGGGGFSGGGGMSGGGGASGSW